MRMTSGNEKVDAIGEINLSGNVTPPLWFKNIKLPSGKPDVISILLLSEIVYWHRPTEQRDETTGQVIGRKKKFKADLLQRSYSSFAEQFGFSKRQVSESIIRLEKMELVERHFKTIFANGQANNNVLFLDVNPDMIRKITYEFLDLSDDGTGSHIKKGEGIAESLSEQENGTGSHIKKGEGYPTMGEGYHIKKGQVSHLNGTAIPFKRGTNTEITTEITTNNINPPTARAESAPVASEKQDEPEQKQNQKPFKFTELPVDENFKALVKLYDETFPGTFNDRVVKHLTIMLEKASLDLIEYAFDHATLSANQPLTLKFIVSILNRWLSKNITTADQARRYEQKHEQDSLNRQNRPGGGGYYGKSGRTEKEPEWFKEQKQAEAEAEDVAKQAEQAQNEPEAVADEREHSPDFKALGMDEREVLAILSNCRPGEQEAFKEMETDLQKQFLDIKRRASGSR